MRAGKRDKDEASVSAKPDHYHYIGCDDRCCRVSELCRKKEIWKQGGQVADMGSLELSDEDLMAENLAAQSETVQDILSLDNDQ